MEAIDGQTHRIDVETSLFTTARGRVEHWPLSRQWPLVLIQAAMANGITVTPTPDPAQLQSLGVASWLIWGCEISTFPWSYDEQETCLLLEGYVSVTPDGGKPVRFGAGDLVVFDTGLSCTWEVHAPVRKHYRFG